MTVAKYALFLFEPHEASGGWDDMKGFYTLESAKVEAELSDIHLVAQIVDISLARVVARGEWSYDPPVKVGGLIAWRYEWKDEP